MENQMKKFIIGCLIIMMVQYTSAVLSTTYKKPLDKASLNFHERALYKYLEQKKKQELIRDLRDAGPKEVGYKLIVSGSGTSPVQGASAVQGTSPVQPRVVSPVQPLVVVQPPKAQSKLSKILNKPIDLDEYQVVQMGVNPQYFCSALSTINSGGVWSVGPYEVMRKLRVQLNDNIPIKMSKPYLDRYFNEYNQDRVDEDIIDRNLYDIWIDFGDNGAKRISSLGRARFPTFSNFKEVPTTPIIKPSDIVMLSITQIKVKFATPMRRAIMNGFMSSQNIKRRGFTAVTPEQRASVKVFKYLHNELAIVRIDVQNPQTQFYLVKISPQSYPSMTDAFNSIIDNVREQPLRPQDAFIVPEIKEFAAFPEYGFQQSQILRGPLKSKRINVMMSQVDVEMTDVEGTPVSQPRYDEKNPKARNLIFNQQFWIVMRKPNKPPYFVMSVQTVSQSLEI